MKKICAIALLVVSLAACRAAGEEGGGERVRGLDEMSREQIRVFLKGYTGDWDKLVSDQDRGIAPPPIQKPYPADAKLVDLVPPGEITVGRMELRRAIEQRRSRRQYTDERLTLEELSFLLWGTQGISRIFESDEGHVRYHFRTVPSGGARHPYETYLLVNRVEGVEPGIYRYLPVEHKLLFLRGGAGLDERIGRICFDQMFIGEAAVVFVWAAIPYRTEWRYSSIGYKDVAIEAGHICQNLYLAAESIGGGACAILGYDQDKIDEFFGLDGEEEFVVYLAPVGKVER